MADRGNGPSPEADTPQLDLHFTPATADDFAYIRDSIERLQMDPENLAPEQFVTLRRAGRLAAFGRIKPYRETFELGSLVVDERERGYGLGERVVRELIRHFPQDEVFITTVIPAYFERLGFLRTTVLPAEIEAKVERVRTHFFPDVVGMIYDRRIERLPTLADTYRARRLIAPHLARTPLVHVPALSRELGCEAYLKLENLQPIGAFKVRGGVYLAANLPSQTPGIIGASTGNHGQSLAYGARLRGIRCVIFMPEKANPMKIAAMRALGAEVVQEGPTFEEARVAAEARARREGLLYVHHINSPQLITGVSTLSLEIVEDLPDVDVIIVPAGGGSGALAHCLIAKSLRPEIEVIAVQAEGAPAIYRSWKEHTLQRAPVDTAAEGVATGAAFHIAVKTFIDKLNDMILVSESEMRDAIALILRTAHVVAEEAAAATVAGARKLGDRIHGKKVAFVISGGNLTLERLRAILGQA